MVAVRLPMAGRLVLTPLPTELGDEDERLADDPPPNAVFVHSSGPAAEQVLSDYRGLLQLTGRIGRLAAPLANPTMMTQPDRFPAHRILRASTAATLSVLVLSAVAAPTIPRLTPPSNPLAATASTLARILPGSSSTCRPPCNSRLIPYW